MRLEEKTTKKLDMFCFEGDLSIQLGKVTKVYAPSSSKGKQGFNVEVKFHNKTQKEDLHVVKEKRNALLPCTHEENMKSWLFATS